MRVWSVRWIMVVAFFLALPAARGQADEKKVAKGPERWEKTIAKFEAGDKERTPEKGGILFVGSSTIVRWDLEKSFSGKQALNRGFGGSTVVDVLHYFDRVVTAYAPKTIVFYSGDNDIASGKAPEEVIGDYGELVKRIHSALPEARVILLGIKPSIARWNLWEKMQVVNAALSKLAEEDGQVEYVDTAPSLLGADGKPRAELFQEDGLHLSEAGYAAWQPLVEAKL